MDERALGMSIKGRACQGDDHGVEKEGPLVLFFYRPLEPNRSKFSNADMGRKVEICGHQMFFEAQSLYKRVKSCKWLDSFHLLKEAMVKL